MTADVDHPELPGEELDVFAVDGERVMFAPGEPESRIRADCSAFVRVGDFR